MIELVFTVCLIGATSECKVLSPSYTSDYPHVLACMREGMVRAAQWQEEHPEWTVQRWKCEHTTV